MLASFQCFPLQMLYEKLTVTLFGIRLALKSVQIFIRLLERGGYIIF